MAGDMEKRLARLEREKRGLQGFTCCWKPDATVQGARLGEEVMERLSGETAEDFVKRVFDTWDSAGGFIEWV